MLPLDLRFNRRTIFLALFASISLGFLSVLSPGSIFILLVTGGIVFFLKRSSLNKDETKFIVYLFIIGLSTRIFSTIIIDIALTTLDKVFEWRGYSIPSLIDDSGYWNLRGQAIAQYLKGLTLQWEALRSAFPYLKGSGYGQGNAFLYIIAWFHYSFGISWVSVKFINCLLGSLSGVIVYFITRELFTKHVAKLSGIIVMFFPSLFLWSMTTLKDTSFIFLSTVIVLSYIKFYKTKRWLYLIIFAISFFFQAGIRSEFLALTILAIAVPYVLTSKYKLLKAITALTLICFIVVLILSGNFGLINYSLKKYIGKTALYHRGHVFTRGSSYRILEEKYYAEEYKERTKLSEMTYVEFSKTFSKAWFYFLLTPFPWHTQTQLQLSVQPQMIIWYILLPFVLIGILFSLRYKWKETFFLLFYLFLITSSIALVSGNTGTTFRHRDMVTPFYLIFSAVGIFNVFSFRMLSNQKSR